MTHADAWLCILSSPLHSWASCCRDVYGPASLGTSPHPMVMGLYSSAPVPPPLPPVVWVVVGGGGWWCTPPPPCGVGGVGGGGWWWVVVEEVVYVCI